MCMTVVDLNQGNSVSALVRLHSSSLLDYQLISCRAENSDQILQQCGFAQTAHLHQPLACMKTQ